MTATGPAPHTVLPTFLVVGAMKSGTTALHRYFVDHPQVFVAQPKELHFFVEDRNYSRGSAWYAEQFAGGRAALARGESSVTYTQHPYVRGVPERIAALVPSVRLVYLVRDPVARMRSHYLHDVAAGVEYRPIARALREQPKYLDLSRYSLQLDQYLPYFPPAQVMVVTGEELRATPEQVLRRVFGFIGVDADWVPAKRREVHRTELKTRPPRTVTSLRTLPAYRSVAVLVPDRLKSSVKQRLPRSPLPPELAAIPASFEQELRERLRPDVARLRAWLPPEWDGWGIA